MAITGTSDGDARKFLGKYPDVQVSCKNVPTPSPIRPADAVEHNSKPYRCSSRSKLENHPKMMRWILAKTMQLL
jgi:hypothetical protein